MLETIGTCITRWADLSIGEIAFQLNSMIEVCDASRTTIKNTPKETFHFR
eukprot:SAG31_NODE_31565_length_366_cov_1.546816_1_plen_49_part_10